MCFGPHVNNVTLGSRNGLSEPDRFARYVVETSSGMTMSL